MPRTNSKDSAFGQGYARKQPAHRAGQALIIRGRKSKNDSHVREESAIRRLHSAGRRRKIAVDF